MPWKCPKCGYGPIPDDIKVCPNCGYAREDTVSAEDREVGGEEVRKQPKRPSLIIVQSGDPALKGREMELLTDLFSAITIGRGPENIVTIPDPYMSYFHAKIVKEEGRYYIYDMNSTNGTYYYDPAKEEFVRIKPGERVELRDGMLLKFGISTIVKVKLPREGTET